MSHALQVQHVTKAFGNLPVLSDVTFALAPGQFGAIVGPSGCGKSTVLRMVAGLDQPDSGEVLVNGQPVAGPGPDRVMIFQEHALYPWRTIADNVAFGLELAGVAKAERLARAHQVLAQVGLDGFADYYPHQLSGGMRQRAAIARALVMDPQLLLLDEPYGALDAITRMNMQAELVQIWQGTGKTMLLITHDIDEALYLADRIFVMSPRPGQVVQTLDLDTVRLRDRNSRNSIDLRESIMEKLGLTV